MSFKIIPLKNQLIFESSLTAPVIPDSSPRKTLLIDPLFFHVPSYSQSIELSTRT